MRQCGQTPEVEAVITALVFRAGPLLCALPLTEVIETMRPMETLPLAGSPTFVLGIGVLRGVPTPVIDVSRLLGGGPCGDPQRFVTVRTERGAVAMATGAVLGIRTIDTAQTGGHPALFGGASSSLVAGVGTVGAGTR